MNPIAALARLRGRSRRVLLHSGSSADQCGRYSFVACDPVAEVTARGSRVTVRDGRREHEFTGCALPVVEELAAAHSTGAVDDAPVPTAIGYVGYDYGSGRGDAEASASEELPDLWFGIYPAVWRHDARGGSTEIVGASGAARESLGRLLSGSASLGPVPRLGPLVGIPDGRARYRRSFERLMEYIHAGDVYQVNLARALAAPVREQGDPLALYRAVDAASPAAFGAVLELDGAAVVSASPERFLYRRSAAGRLETRPIKGTRRRTGEISADRAAAAELARDPKEAAEHLMIVDLERNDLGRVATIGSVRVDSIARVVELPTLFHLVSTVSCQPRDGVGFADAVTAAFPGGSITGAPKKRACEIIEELEESRRGVYTGSIGYLGAGGRFDLSIAIRTAVLTPDRLELRVGGGIVADSTWEREWEETEEKAAAWRSALACE